MRAPSVSLLICATVVAGCGTKTIADLDEQELASEDGGSSSDDGGPGQTVTSGVETTTSAGAETGELIECEPDPNATCGPTPAEDIVAIVTPPAPIGSGQTPEQSEYDCTVTELEFMPGAARIILDCGLEFPVDVSMAIEQVTFDKLAIDQAVHVAFATETAGNGQSITLSIDDAPLVIMMNGTTVDPIPGTEVFAPFTVVAETDVCLAPCAVEEDRCYSFKREQLSFSHDGDPVATVWSQSQDTVTIDGTDYRISVLAQGSVEVNPSSSWCDIPGYDGYSFRIADVTP